MPNEYDISRAFKRIENDLIDSMMRNLKRHQVEEAELGKEWEQWQAIQLAELEEYRKNNAQLFSGDFSDIQEKIDDMFWATYEDAQSAEEHRLMDRIKKGDFRPTEDKGAFFRLNEPKLQALLMATKADFTRAEYAMLRRAEDQYRKIIFDSMTYANITNDYGKAVDMATKDFLKAGINCIQYKGWTDKNGKYHRGAMHDMSDYASMALRTGNKRAYLMGEGDAHDRYGLHTVRVNRRTQACPKCVGFLGRLLIDDVYGGGTRAEATAKGIPTLSDAMQAGFLHPNCKDIYSVYIEGVSQPAKPWTQEEISEIVGDYNQEQELKHAEDMKESYERMAKYSLDPENQQRYQQRANDWQARLDEIKNTPPIPVEPPVVSPMPTSEDTIATLADEITKAEAEYERARATANEWVADATEYNSTKAYADQIGSTAEDVFGRQLRRAERHYANNPTEELEGEIEKIKRILSRKDEFGAGGMLEQVQQEAKDKFDKLMGLRKKLDDLNEAKVKPIRQRIAEIKAQDVGGKLAEAERQHNVLKDYYDGYEIVKASSRAYNQTITERLLELEEKYRKKQEARPSKLFADFEEKYRYIRTHLQEFEDGTYADDIKAQIKTLKKQAKTWQKELDAEYDALENIIGVPNMSQLSAYKEKNTNALKHLLDDAPTEYRGIWNEFADNFKVLSGSGKRAYYSPSQSGVKLSINSASKGSSYQTPYQVVFHEYGHAIDWELNRKYGNGKRMESFTENYKGGIFGKTIQKEANEAIEKFAKERGLMSTPNKGTVVTEADKMVRRGLLRQDEKAEWIRTQMQTVQIDRIEAEKQFCEYIKGKYDIYQRTDISDMFESVMTTTDYPCGVGHGKKYWGSKMSSFKQCGEEAFAEMYSAVIANEESWEVIQEFFPESVAIFKDILEVTKL